MGRRICRCWVWTKLIDIIYRAYPSLENEGKDIEVNKIKLHNNIFWTLYTLMYDMRGRSKHVKRKQFKSKSSSMIRWKCNPWLDCYISCILYYSITQYIFLSNILFYYVSSVMGILSVSTKTTLKPYVWEGLSVFNFWSPSLFTPSWTHILFYMSSLPHPNQASSIF